jgi:para-nitrobenzyl esterase
VAVRGKTLFVAVIAVLLIGTTAVALALLPSCGSSGDGVSSTSPSPPPSPKPARVVDTGSGRVRGAIIDGVPSYLGIPYAAPPVGPLRWRPPQPPASWTGVRECVAYGSSCPQTDSGYQTGQTAGASSEDCLYLNVYTPAQSRHERRCP